MSPVLKRDIINIYIKAKGLKNLVGFFDHLVTEGVFDFMDFINQKNSDNTTNQSILMHGSLKQIDKLNILQSDTKESHIYATDNSNYAIFLAIINVKKYGRASVNISKNEFSITTSFINGESKISNGYVHIVSKKYFVPTSNTEYISSQLAHVIFSVPVTFDDLTETVIIKGH